MFSKRSDSEENGNIQIWFVDIEVRFEPAYQKGSSLAHKES